MRGNDIRRTAYKRVATIGGKDHRGRHRRFEEGIEVGETFNVEHVDLSHSVGMGEITVRKRRTSSIKTTPGTTSATPWST